MKIIIDNYKNMNNNEPLTITIGNFDGLHLGHQQLIDKTKLYLDTKSAVLSFNPHPMKVLRDVSFLQLTSLEQKIKLIKAKAIDYCFIVNFNNEFANLTADEFMAFLKTLNVKRVVIGRDFRFGIYTKGNAQTLEKHFEVVVVEDILNNNTKLSSTSVKDLIFSGNLQLAKQFLGRDYEIEGLVIHGTKIGRTLGFPTANLDYNSYVLPKNGVYYSTVEIDGKIYAGALNIGYNPTLNFNEQKRVEIHVLDFNQEIYGKKVIIKFKKYLRPEFKFTEKAELIETLKDDIESVRKLFKKEVI